MLHIVVLNYSLLNFSVTTNSTMLKMSNFDGDAQFLHTFHLKFTSNANIV